MVDSTGLVWGPLSSEMIENYLFKNNDYGGKTYHYKKDINLTFYYGSYLTVNTTVEALTGKKHINLNTKDMNDYLEKLKEIVCTVLVDKNIYDEIPKMLSRIDYKLDIYVPNEIEKATYLEFLTQLDDKYRWLKKREDYDTSKYLTGKYSMRRINLYDRYSRTHKEEDKNIIRLEVQNFKRALVANKKKLGISRDLINYWNSDMWQEWLIDILKDYMILGAHHYKIKTAFYKIDTSNNSDIIKKRLKKFLKDSLKFGGMSGLREHYDRVTFSKYVKLLQKLRNTPTCS